jgi:hypothetical protein
MPVKCMVKRTWTRKMYRMIDLTNHLTEKSDILLDALS